MTTEKQFIQQFAARNPIAQNLDTGLWGFSQDQGTVDLSQCIYKSHRSASIMRTKFAKSQYDESCDEMLVEDQAEELVDTQDQVDVNSLATTIRDTVLSTGFTAQLDAENINLIDYLNCEVMGIAGVDEFCAEKYDIYENLVAELGSLAIGITCASYQYDGTALSINITPYYQDLINELLARQIEFDDDDHNILWPDTSGAATSYYLNSIDQNELNFISSQSQLACHEIVKTLVRRAITALSRDQSSTRQRIEINHDLFDQATDQPLVTADETRIAEAYNTAEKSWLSMSLAWKRNLMNRLNLDYQDAAQKLHHVKNYHAVIDYLNQ